MNRRGLTLLEMILAIGITATIGAAIASMMAAVSNGLTSRDMTMVVVQQFNLQQHKFDSDQHTSHQLAVY